MNANFDRLAVDGLGLRVIPSIDDDGTGVWLLAPDNRFWPQFIAAHEYADGLPDPLDRYSKRVLTPIARATGHEPVYPSDGPPFAPFIAWAKASGQVFPSPSGLLVHIEFGLWISFRGAFLGGAPKLAPTPHPCVGCAAPCLSSCPVGALSPTGYDFRASRAYLRSGDVPCWNGCLARRACIRNHIPRDPAQSRFHMISFAG